MLRLWQINALGLSPKDVMLLLDILGPLVAIAFYTLLERNFIAGVQLRKGPNKVTILALLQPLLDAGKLFLKHSMDQRNRLFTMFRVVPQVSLLVVLAIWLQYPHLFKTTSIPTSLMFVLLLSGLGTYTTFLAG